jgi:hypothetical protein
MSRHIYSTQCWAFIQCRNAVPYNNLHESGVGIFKGRIAAETLIKCTMVGLDWPAVVEHPLRHLRRRRLSSKQEETSAPMQSRESNPDLHTRQYALLYVRTNVYPGDFR